MIPAATVIALALGQALLPSALPPSPAPGGMAAAAPKGKPPRAPVAALPIAEGEILEVDHRAHTLRLRTADVELVLSFDRNTVVRGPDGAATPLLLKPGARARVGRDGDARAAWVEVTPPPSTPASAP